MKPEAVGESKTHLALTVDVHILAFNFNIGAMPQHPIKHRRNFARGYGFELAVTDLELQSIAGQSEMRFVLDGTVKCQEFLDEDVAR